jgi:transcriptional regulator with XRE-family HTH domain
VKRYSYGERDYAFGQLMLTLRTTIGLTQAGLAEVLQVHRRAVAGWEAGSSYPKAEHLKELITLGVRVSAFAAGREEEEIRALWKAAHQKVLLDEAWLRDLLAPPVPIPLFPQAQPPVAPEAPAAFPRVDLVEALDVSHFAGREVEVAELSQWILEERCRLVTLLGMGGIGKSMLASYLGSRLVRHFEAVLWRSVRDAPMCEELVADCTTFFSETPPTEFPTLLEQRINQLVARLQASRCLLVLDNLETLLASGDREGGYLPGYEGYGRLIGRLAESAHQSCVLLTWLAVLREWTHLDTLSQVLHPRVLRSQLLEALEALSRRTLLERGQQASFGLQSVVMEYLTDELGERLSEEIVRGPPKLLRQVALAQAQAKNYVRKSQVRLLVHPLLERLRAELGANAQVEAHLLGLLALFRTEDAATEGYGPANVITLLIALRGHLRGLDLSRLSIRGAYLQGVELQDASLSGALLQECVFTETFDAIWAVAISQSGQHWAAAGRPCSGQPGAIWRWSGLHWPDWPRRV